ncbi:MAG: type II secretion system protein [Candidatus Omnitrophica bacterium]|nr:type II secretion system protein [Candidatus Omnitrophota bacterium]
MNLIELITVIAIVGIMSGVVFGPIVSGVNLWNAIQFRDDATSQGRLALERMVREMSWVKDDKSVVTANSTTFTFVSALSGNETVTFQYDAANSRILRGADLLVGGVTACSITYYNAANGAISVPLVGNQRTDIVRMQLTVTLASGTQSVTVQEMIYPRNFFRKDRP